MSVYISKTELKMGGKGVRNRAYCARTHTGVVCYEKSLNTLSALLMPFFNAGPINAGPNYADLKK